MDEATHFDRPLEHLPTRDISDATSAEALEGAQWKAEVCARERILAVSILVFSTSAFVNLLPGGAGIEYEQEGKFAAQILWSFLYMFMLFIVRKQIPELLYELWRNKSLTLLLGWAIISVLWSINRTVTIRHCIALLLCSFFGVYLGSRYKLREQLRLVSIALLIVLASSVAACLLFPEYGIKRPTPFDDPAWVGVFTDKNTLGRLAVLATLILFLYFLKRSRRSAIIVGITILFFVVVQTDAKTSLVYFILATLAFPFVRMFHVHPQKRNVILTVGLVIFGGLAAWCYYNWENLTYSLGKDPQLTGRVSLWVLSPVWIGEHPYIGHGFDAFWSDFYGPAADFRAASGWLEAPHAHNGLINLWIDLGAVGVILLSLGMALAFRNAIRLASLSNDVEGLWPITYLAFYLLYSLPEVTFLSRNDFLWILYVALATSLWTLGAARRQASFAGVS